jgi:hypothetical protein
MGDDASHLSPYSEQDYILCKIVRLDKRNDYTTFPFHREWEKARDHIWQGSKEEAVESYRQVIAELRRSPDLIPRHVNQLTTYYRAKFQEELKAYEQEQDPTLSITEAGTDAFKKSVKRISELDVSDGAIGALTKGVDFFIELAETRNQTTEPKGLDETDIEAALDSSVLNDPSVRSADPDALTAALSLEMPIL